MLAKGLPPTVAVALAPPGPALESLLRRANRSGFRLGAAALLPRGAPAAVRAQLVAAAGKAEDSAQQGAVVAVALVRPNAAACLASEAAQEPSERRKAVLLAPKPSVAAVRTRPRIRIS